MINKDYELQLERIEQQLDNHQYEEAHENIEWLKELKPVPLKLNALEAKYHLLVGNDELVTKCLDNKWKLDYDYDGLFDALQVYEALWDKLGNEKEQARYHYMKQLVRYMGTDTPQWQECEDYQHRLEALGQKFYETGGPQILEEMAGVAYTMSDAVWCAVIRQYFCVKGISAPDFLNREWVDELPNMGWIKEQLERQGGDIVILADEHNLESCKAMARMLSDMGKSIWLVVPPKPWKYMDENIVMAEESLRMQERAAYGIQNIPSFSLQSGLGQQLDNRAAIVGSLFLREEIEGLAMVVATGNLANDLEMEDILKKQYSRFNFGQGDLLESNLSVGWAGDYCDYISTIYNHDVKEWIDRKPTCKYSIVISARNSSDTLRHALRTCLELDYPKAQYEIVISDNSSDDNEGVYELCESLDDDRIQYYRMPRDLQPAKCFEYGFLQTRGEFILSMGADDAVLPWALQVLDDIREQHPKEPIIQWQYGFYVWKEAGNKQENLFRISEKYQLGEYGEHYALRTQYMRDILQNSQFMYMLPSLHINSGCKREYMRHLLQETNRLWDGATQDIYMGIMNMLVNEQILNIKYPLTIAGISHVSKSGDPAMLGEDEAEGMQSHNVAKATGNTGVYCRSFIERLLPDFSGSNVDNLYHSLLRAAARGVLPDTYMAEIFDWKKMFWECAVQLNARDAEFDKRIQVARYTASWHGEEFLKWFDDAIYEPIIQPTRYEEDRIQEMEKTQAYVEGETEFGGMIVDASKHGVENVYDAVQLFVELSGLGKDVES